MVLSFLFWLLLAQYNFGLLVNKTGNFCTDANVVNMDDIMVLVIFLVRHMLELELEAGLEGGILSILDQVPNNVFVINQFDKGEIIF